MLPKPKRTHQYLILHQAYVPPNSKPGHLSNIQPHDSTCPSTPLNFTYPHPMPFDHTTTESIQAGLHLTRYLPTRHTWPNPYSHDPCPISIACSADPICSNSTWPASFGNWGPTTCIPSRRHQESHLRLCLLEYAENLLAFMIITDMRLVINLANSTPSSSSSPVTNFPLHKFISRDKLSTPHISFFVALDSTFEPKTFS